MSAYQQYRKQPDNTMTKEELILEESHETNLSQDLDLAQLKEMQSKLRQQALQSREMIASDNNRTASTSQTRLSRLGRIKDTLEERNLNTINLNNASNIKQTLGLTMQGDSDDLLQECEKLKKSYSQHRKPSKSKERQSHHQQAKENGLSVSNRFKRAKQSQKSLQNYQEKYSKLEQNFKKFTQNMQEKRSTSNNQGAQATTYQTTQQPNITLLKSSDLSPLRDTSAQLSPNFFHSKNSFNILAQSHDLNERDIQNATNQNMQTIQKSINTNNNINHKQMMERMSIGELDTNTMLRLQGTGALDLAIEMLPVEETSDRVKMLQSLVSRLNLFMNQTFERLFILCVSRQQESQFHQLQQQVDTMIRQAAQSVQNLSLKLENQEKEQEEYQRVQLVFDRSMEILQASFKTIHERIFKVDSETFKNYKYKDTIACFENILQESHRLNLYQLMPNLIETMIKQRQRAALAVIKSIHDKQNVIKMRNNFCKWRTKAGMVQYFTKSRKQANLVKVLNRWMHKQSQFSVVKCLHTWKDAMHTRKQQLASTFAYNSMARSRGLGASTFTANCMSDQTFMQLLFLNSEVFNQCMSNDSFMVNFLCEQIYAQFNLHADILLFETEDEQAMLTVYDSESGHQPKQIFLESLIDRSLTGNALKEGQKFMFTNIYASKQFNEQIDEPFYTTNLRTIKYSDLNMQVSPMITAQDNSLKGLVRFFSPQKMHASDQETMETLSKLIGSFIDRIHTMRYQLGSLSEQLNHKTEDLTLVELDRFVFEELFSLLNQMNGKSKSEFLDLVQEHSSKILDSMLEGCSLRQIINHQVDTNDRYALKKVRNINMLSDQNGQALIRSRDHDREQQTLLEDFLDYQKEVLIHQISLHEQDSDFTFIIHRSLDKHANQKLETVSLSLHPALRLFSQCMSKIIIQALVLYDDLGGKIINQGSKFAKVDQMHQTRDSIRNEFCIERLQELTSESDMYLQLSDSIQKVLTQQCEAIGIQKFGLMLNSSICTGHALSEGCMYAYQLADQNVYLQMPEEVTDELQHDNQLSRFEAQIDQISHLKQQFQCKDRIISVVLPFNSSNQQQINEQTTINPDEDRSQQQAMIQIVPFAMLKTEIEIDEEADKSAVTRDVKSIFFNVQKEIQQTMEILYQNRNRNAQFSSCYNNLQQQIDSLNADLDFSHSVQELLVLPFTQQPSLRQLGLSLKQLSQKIIKDTYVNKISLVFMEEYKQIEDIVDGDGTRKTPVSDQSIREVCENEDNQNLLFKEDEACIYMRMAAPEQQQRLSGGPVYLVLQINLLENSLNNVQFTFNQIQVFQLVVHPFVSNALGSISMLSLLSSTQERLPRVLKKIADNANYRSKHDFFAQVRSLQLNKVPIFTRLKCYQNICKRKENFGLDQSHTYGLEKAKEFKMREMVLKTLGRVFRQLNTNALKIKKSYFDQIKMQIQAQKEAQEERDFVPIDLTKKQRKCLSILMRMSKTVTLRRYFCRMAIMANQFKQINNPVTKLVASIECLNYSSYRFKQRIALQKLRAHASKACYRDYASTELKDQQLMLQLNRILLQCDLQSQQAQMNLETAFMTVLEQAMTYVQQSLAYEFLNVIIVTVKQHSDRRAKAYVFNSRLVDGNSFDHNHRASDDSIQKLHLQSNENFEDIKMMVQNIEGLKDFTLSCKKDIILQMLDKSRTIFNFQNISQSLFDLYVQHQGKSVDGDIANRMLVVKKSKSALVMPLTAGDKFVGSLELYRFHQQTFDEELETRMESFVRLFSSDVMPLYMQMRQSVNQAESLQRQISRNSKPNATLSGLLRNIFFNGPTQLNAAQVLPIIVNTQSEQAYFYQFKDNHIYNFKYEDTFIEEIVDMSCVIELVENQDMQQNQHAMMSQDELQNNNILLSCGSDVRSNTNILNNQSHDMFDLAMETQTNLHNQTQTNNNMRKSIRPAGAARSVTNESFYHIVYYPVLDRRGGVIAILEVAYNSAEKVPQQIINDTVNNFIDGLRHQLHEYKIRLKGFCTSTDCIVNKKDTIQKSKVFQRWKTAIIFDEQRKNFLVSQKQTIQKTENCFNEYVKNVDSCNQEIRKLSDEKQYMLAELQTLKIDRQTKLKFLGTALFLLRHAEKKIILNKQKDALQKWRHQVQVSRIAELAFNKIIELNHRHSQSRFETSCYLLMKTIGKSMKRDAFESILTVVNMAGYRSRSRSQTRRRIDASSIASNHSFVSMHPQNFVPQERNELFTNMIGSFASTKVLASAMKNNADQTQQSYLNESSFCQGVVPRRFAPESQIQSLRKKSRSSSRTMIRQ